ncbi:glycosyltransferase family 4 protein [Candidatus Methylopumilus universalis]|nr:glycosyltransferase family 4 protein [Candidatus Methylopumilus universalis]
MKPSLIFVATTPFAVNAFLRNHLITLSKSYEITLCVNTIAYPLSEEVLDLVSVCHIDIARQISPVKDLVALFQLLFCFRKLRPTIIHSVTPKAGLLAMIAGYILKVPLRFHTFTGQVWANKKGSIRFLLKTMDKLIAFCATRVFADSASQSCFLENQGVVRRGKISILGKGSLAGVDLKRFRPNPIFRKSLRAELELSDESLVFLFVGRIVRDKGIYDLLEAFVLISQTHADWQLWIVGPDEGHIKTALETSKFSSIGRVYWFGETSKPELYMAAADVLVLPSYREGFGSVIIEAAACGIPCVAYRIDGVVDAIISGKTGLLVEVADIRSLANSMQLMGNQKDKREKLGKAAYSRAVKNFSSSSISKSWEKFYEDTLRKNM